MKVGILNAIRNNSDHPYDLQRVYADYIEDILLAEQMGLDFCWLGEHRSTPDDWTPSPLIVIAALAAQTRTMRFAPSILCMPFHHPLRVAEDIAVLDILSGGRIDLGFGVGSQIEEFEMFGVDPGERVSRTWEAIDLIHRCFTEEWGFDHQGKYYQFGRIKLNARPVQAALPFWMGGFGPRNVQRAAERGFHLMAGGSKAASAMYDGDLAAAGREPGQYHQGPLMMVSIADTEEEAYAKSAEGFCYFMNFYSQRRQIEGDRMRAPAVTPETLKAVISRPGSPFILAIGNPDQVREAFVAIRDGARGRITHCPVAFRHAGMTTAATRQSMELFGAHVLPALRD